MYTIDDRDKVVTLNERPRPNVGAPMPFVVSDEGHLFLSYGLAPRSDEQVILRFSMSESHHFGPPNEETLSGHPLWTRGLRHYGAFEVVGSSWIRSHERMDRMDSTHDPDRYETLHHYIFTFHDETFECIATVVVVVSRFPNDTDSVKELLHKIATLLR
jgi:hypothetical protein